MSDAMAAYLIIGGLSAAWFLVPAIYEVVEAHDLKATRHGRQQSARRALMWLGVAALAVPLWPALLVAVLARGLWWLIRTAYPKAVGQ